MTLESLCWDRLPSTAYRLIRPQSVSEDGHPAAIIGGRVYRLILVSSQRKCISSEGVKRTPNLQD